MVFYFHTGNLPLPESARQVFTSAFPSGNQAAEEEQGRSHPLGTTDGISCPPDLLKTERDFPQLPEGAGSCGTWGIETLSSWLEQPGGGSELRPMAAGRLASAFPSGLSPLKRKT